MDMTERTDEELIKYIKRIFNKDLDQQSISELQPKLRKCESDMEVVYLIEKASTSQSQRIFRNKKNAKRGKPVQLTMDFDPKKTDVDNLFQ